MSRTRERASRWTAVMMGALCLSCTQAASAPKRDLTGKDMTMAESRQALTTEREVIESYGKVATVVGTYEIKPFLNKKNEKLRDWPVLVLKEGKRGVLIESIWDVSKAPSPETIARYKGRQVEVVGKLHAAPPGSIQNMAVPCISPVESIRLLP